MALATTPYPALISITDDTFEAEVLRSDLPVMVEFTADWCPPCKMIAPVLAELAAELAGRLRMVQIDVDANPLSMRTYQVMSMPTLMVFRAGEPLKALVGARPKGRLRAELTDILGW